MDIMMPVLDGFSACREIRKTKDIPVLMLSARGKNTINCAVSRWGIDDYVVKPFSPKELMMRVKVIITRNGRNYNNLTDILELDGLKIDFTGRMVSIDGIKISLSPKEYELLFYLVKNRNIALSREKLISEIWGYDYDGDDRTLDTHIKLLRNNLGRYRDRIVTLRGVGYAFED